LVNLYSVIIFVKIARHRVNVADNEVKIRKMKA
jgi:hypothetical protein